MKLQGRHPRFGRSLTGSFDLLAPFQAESNAEFEHL
jgi:hypothetical protein